MKIAIIGSGMFGFALASHLGRKHLKNEKITIMSYDINKKLVNYLKKNRAHLYHFSYKKLTKNINFTDDKKELVNDADIVIFAVTSQSVRETIREIKLLVKDGVIFVLTAKALEVNTGKIFSVVINEEMKGSSIKYINAKLSGGTFANDIVDEAPLGVDIACENKDALKKLQDIFHFRTLRVYGTTDLIGVEYAGAFKNIIAIFAGIVNGLDLPYGSETHMISRAAREAKEIAISLGSKSNTFSMESQCWGNDLWMSCTGKSRNREFGRLIGSGLSSKEALEKMQKAHKLVEGYYATATIPKLCQKTKLENHIFNEIYKIIYEDKKAKESIEQLMSRDAEFI